jgi:HlyD family secretion protein
MQVDTSVSESDIGDIAVGNETRFTVEAYPDRLFQGRYVQVRQAPQTVQNVVTYDAVVEAPNTDLLLKPGMTAAARIVTQRHENVLLVPSQALRFTPAVSGQAGYPAGNSVAQNRATARIWVLRNGSPAPVTFQAGLNDGNSVEVLSGELSPGDPVIISQKTAANSRGASGPGQMIPRAPRL